MSDESSAHTSTSAEEAVLERRYAQVGGIRLHYVIAGLGEPLLLIHGFPQTWHTWRGVIAALARSYTVIAPDYRGAGASERTQGGYDKHTLMEDLRGLVLASMLRQIAQHGRIHLVANAGHWLCEENPREVARSLLEFFAEAAPQS